MIGIAAGTIELKQNDAIPGESGRATRLIDNEFGPKASETVLVQSTTLTANDPAFRAAVGDVVGTLRPFAVVGNIDSPYTRGNRAQISPDGHSALVNFEFESSRQDALKISKPVEDAVAGVQKAHPELTIAEFGDGSSAREVEGQFTKDLAKAGLLSLPVTLIILLITFGALVAAGIPLLLALTSVIATMFLIALPSHLHAGRRAGQRGDPADWARGRRRLLALLSQARTRGTRSGAQRVSCTGGRGGDVGTFGADLRLHRHDRDGGHVLRRRSVVLVVRTSTIMVVATAMLGSLTVLPAVLSKLGDRVEKGRVPLLHRLKRDDGEGRVWGWILDRVLHVLACPRSSPAARLSRSRSRRSA